MSSTPNSQNPATSVPAAPVVGLNPQGKAVLGRFEEALLMSAMIVGPNATAKAISDHVEASLGGRTMGTVLTTLDRLAEKGYVESTTEEEPTKRRGGRRRLLYKVTESGRENTIRSVSIVNRLAEAAGLFKVA